MHAYRVTAPNHEPMVIFAPTEDKAAEIFVTWQQCNGIGHTDFEIDTAWATELTGIEQKNMLEALRHPNEGIGCRYSDLLGWGVKSAYDERPK